MSELINNSQKRKELLKQMILRLHAGEDQELVRTQLSTLLKSIPYDEVVEVEQELINEGLPAEEVLKFCDVHTSVLEGHIDHSNASPIPAGHPVDLFQQENREIEKYVALTNKVLDEIGNLPVSQDGSVYSVRALAYLNALQDVDKHYRRKENLLFPFLEKKGITGPPTVMWGKQDEIRKFLKEAQLSLNQNRNASIGELISKSLPIIRTALKSLEDMILKEEEILFPMTMKELTEKEWFEIYQQTPEIGFCLIDPVSEWKPNLEDSEISSTATGSDDGIIRLPSGSFSSAELTALLNTLPIDITFIDNQDKVKFFSQGEHRIFDRNRAILGRDVRMCHPPQSVHIVDKILEDFKSGKETSAPFWIQMGGKFIYINYFPLKDNNGNYLGTFEFSQDLTELRALEGEQRLLSYGGPKA